MSKRTQPIVDRNRAVRARLARDAKAKKIQKGIEWAASVLARNDGRRAWEAADVAAQRELEQRHGVIVEIGSEVRLYRRAEHAPSDARRVRTSGALEDALRRARGLRVHGVRNTSSPLTAAQLRGIAAPIFND